MDATKFITPVSVPKSNVTISHQQPILLIGSCFTQNIGKKLIDYKFDVNINPNGIIYNPISVVNTLKRVTKNHLYTEKELFQINDKWISFNHHSSFSSFDKNTCLKDINSSITKAHEHLKKCTTIFVSFGSAWIYEYLEMGVVANCHKIPSKEFEKRLLSVKEVIGAFEDMYDELKIVNSNVNIIFTVSPIRHIKDGLHKNNLSKATLLLAISNLVEQNENCHYFPSYELVIDELRDYRFYKDDLIHPTEMAIKYVWDKFVATYCNENTMYLITEIQKIKTAVNHKPFSFKSEKHQQFITKQIELMNALSKKHPFLDLENEKMKIQRN